MNFTTVNEQALIEAATFVVGAEATNAIMRLYLVIDKAQNDAFELGLAQGMEGLAAATDEAWDHGYDTGEADGLADAERVGDDAYVQGVADARARPAEADQNVAEIAAQYAFNGEFDDGGPYNEDNVQDSGDETSPRYFSRG